MMTQRASIYAKVLYSLQVKEEHKQEAEDIVNNNKELIQALANPIIGYNEKEAVIDALFEKDITAFLKVLVKNNCIEIVTDIFMEYEKLVLRGKNIISAVLTYASKPNDIELEQIKEMICQKFNKADVILELIEDTSLIGGYVLTIGDTEYDKSIKGTLQGLQKTLSGR